MCGLNHYHKPAGWRSVPAWLCGEEAGSADFTSDNGAVKLRLSSGCHLRFDLTMRPLSPRHSVYSSLQKYRVDMPGSNSAFIPTINAITTSQDLQWMVQPTVITSMSSPYTRSHPYGHHLTNGPGLLGHNTMARPGVIRSIGDARGRRKRDEQVREINLLQLTSYHITKMTVSFHFICTRFICHVLPFLTLSSPQKKRRRGG